MCLTMTTKKMQEQDQIPINSAYCMFAYPQSGIFHWACQELASWQHDSLGPLHNNTNKIVKLKTYCSFHISLSKAFWR